MFNDKQIAALSDKLDARHIKARSQAGRQLSYLEGWHVIAEANRIFGYHAWDRQLTALREIGSPREVDGKWRIAYMATVRITVTTPDGHEIIRDGSGYGSGIDKDLGQAHESALKEAETDAMKRAMMTFGNPFGLALYDKTQENVGQPISDGERAAAATIRMGIDMAETLEELASFWKEHSKHVKELPPALSDELTKAKDARKAALTVPANAAE